MVQVLGRGSFGKVVLVKKKQKLENTQEGGGGDTEAAQGAAPGGKVYAMKVIKKKNLKTAEHKHLMMSERFVMKELEHPFLSRLR